MPPTSWPSVTRDFQASARLPLYLSFPVKPETFGFDPTGTDLMIITGRTGSTTITPATLTRSRCRWLRRSTPSSLRLIGIALADATVTVACVCGGSLILAMAGLIERRPANTHHIGVD